MSMKRTLFIGLALLAVLMLCCFPELSAKESGMKGSMLTKRCLNCHKDYKDMENILVGEENLFKHIDSFCVKLRIFLAPVAERRSGQLL